MTDMDSAFILAALREKYPTAAIVPEVTIEDFDLPDSNQEVEHLYKPGLATPEGHKFTRRIDALMFESLMRTAIEIKVTRADFMRDTHWKRRMWQRHTHRFVYVVPHDLDVMTPHGIGLWKVTDDKRIEVVKKAIVSRTPEPLPQTVVQRLAYRAVEDSRPGYCPYDCSHCHEECFTDGEPTCPDHTERKDSPND